jgi:hypothetical protein
MIPNRPQRDTMLFFINEMRMIENGITSIPCTFENDHILLWNNDKSLMADQWPFSFLCAVCPLAVKYDRPNREIIIVNAGVKHYVR